MGLLCDRNAEGHGPPDMQIFCFSNATHMHNMGAPCVAQKCVCFIPQQPQPCGAVNEASHAVWHSQKPFLMGSNNPNNGVHSNGHNFFK